MNAKNKTFLLGGEFEINRISYGAMRLTGQPGNFGEFADWNAGKRLLERAVELGVQHFDSARAYGPHWSEKIIADTLAPYSDNLLIASKGGINKSGVGREFITVDGKPESIKDHIETSLENLKTDCIGMYYLHKPDPSVPIAESIGAIEEARVAGKVRFIAISNVTLPQLKEAMSVTKIAAVQNRFDPANGGDEEVLNFTTENNIAFVPWGPLGANPFDQESPFTKDGFDGDESLNPVQRALVALLNRAPNILPIPGTKSIKHLEENVAAWEAAT